MQGGFFFSEGKVNGSMEVGRVESPRAPRFRANKLSISHILVERHLFVDSPNDSSKIIRLFGKYRYITTAYSHIKH